MGGIGTGILWLIPLLAWWTIDWSADYRLGRGPLLALWGALLIPPVLATWVWLRGRSSRRSLGGRHQPPADSR